MLPLMLETILEIVLMVSSGVLLAGWLTPIPWKFPNYDRQIVVNKIAGWFVVTCSVLLALHLYVETLL